MIKESIAVTYWLPKTSALVFDRIVYLGPRQCPDQCPDSVLLNLEEISGLGGTSKEFELEFLINGEDISASVGDNEFAENEQVYSGSDANKAFKQTTVPIIRWAADEIRFKAGIPACPIYHSSADYNREYRPGNHQVIISTLENLQIIDENELTWDQVSEFRKDTSCQRKYQHFLHWLDGSMLGKSQNFIEHEIEQRIEDYREAISKHGIKTLLGAVSDILDPKIFAAAAVGVAALPSVSNLLAFASTGGIVLGNVALKIVSRYLDFKDACLVAQKDISFVLEIDRKLK